LTPDRPYVNDYCFAYEVRDRKVLHIREYMDTRGGWVQVFRNDGPRALLSFIERQERLHATPNPALRPTCYSRLRRLPPALFCAKY
jgi:hypothetical protein